MERQRTALAALIVVIVATLLALWWWPLPKVQPITAVERGVAGAPTGDLDVRELRGQAPEAAHATRADGELSETDALHLTVRNLVDGSVIAGARFTIQDTVGEVTSVASDERGVLRVGRRAAAHMKPASGRWHLAEGQLESLHGGGDIWLFDDITLNVALVPDRGTQGPLPLESTQLQVLPLGGLTRFVGDLAPEPWSRRWLPDHGFGGHTVSPRWDSGGAADVSVARLRWIGLRALAPHWASDLVEVALEDYPDDTRIAVTLAMRALPTLRVEVKDERGDPVAGAEVRVSVIWQTSSQVEFSRLQVSGWSYGASVGPDGITTVRWVLGARSDARGSASFEICPRGELMITAHARGFLPGRWGFVDLTEDKKLDMALTRSGGEATDTLLVWGGQPIRSASLVLLDLTDEQREFSVESSTDEAGSFRAEWLQPGHRYGIFAHGGNLRALASPGEQTMGYIRWDGRGEVDLLALPKLAEDLVKAEEEALAKSRR